MMRSIAVFASNCIIEGCVADHFDLADYLNENHKLKIENPQYQVLRNPFFLNLDEDVSVLLAKDVLFLFET